MYIPMRPGIPRLARKRRPDSRGVAREQVLLELRSIGRVDRQRREVAKPGRHAVDDLAALDDPVDQRPGGLDAPDRVRMERDGS